VPEDNSCVLNRNENVALLSRSSSKDAFPTCLYRLPTAAERGIIHVEEDDDDESYAISTRRYLGNNTSLRYMFVTELLVGRGKDTRAVTHISHPISNVSVEDGERMSKVASGAGGGGGGGWDISLVLRRSKLNKAQESCEEVKEVKEEVKKQSTCEEIVGSLSLFLSRTVVSIKIYV
tara:strand:+ start:302 stop:832 length:531 start_codon:yes stop_codon:yes gene_type:complete